MGLGDAIERALRVVGVTPERVSAWVGKPCNCEERKERLNALGWWAARVLSGHTSHAAEYLRRVTGG